MTCDHYDVIVIGSGPAGAAVAQRLAPTGKRILVLERGGYLKREVENWSTREVFNRKRYKAKERWRDGGGKEFAPMLHYNVGGNSKVYGAALVRMRREDFGAVRHVGGVSPAWPLPYEAFAPYYLEAERLYHVHGRRGEDPSEPDTETPFPYEPVRHEPRIAQLSADLAAQGLRPFHLPLGILLDQKPDSPEPTAKSACVRCAAFDGFPCLTNGKADAQIVSVDPMLESHENVALLTGAYVARLETDPSCRRVSRVVVERDGAVEQFSADIVVVACGALNSALLLLRSHGTGHPSGLANGSDQVGRNYMRHNQSVLLAVSRTRNDTVFQKTLGLSDWYFGSGTDPHPMGFVQMCGKIHGEHIRGELAPRSFAMLSGIPLETVAHHALDFWLSSEDLPDPANRVTLDADGIARLALTPNNVAAHTALIRALEGALDATNLDSKMLGRSFYVKKTIPIGGVSHQAGTLRFGDDPRHNVLDRDCRAHEVDNLYVADSSCFPSVGAVNPTLTIVANALRVADVIRTRLG